MTVSFDLPLDFAEQIARKLAELNALPQKPSVQPYLDVEQAAEYLACEKDRIYDLKAIGKLRFAKDGRRLLFRREWLDEALESDAA